ncbi:MAG: T9SS type A sorting domain-containing protein [Bacteroidetes bacterium]|nr:T9SS type A sorting domain-containing protein [Bacteroidota bacterium]
MKRLLVFVGLSLIFSHSQAQTGSSVEVLRNHKSALSHVFDPSTDSDVFLVPTDEMGEMPMPTGINESLRKQIDAARTAKLHQKAIENRGILNDRPTPSNITKPVPQRGTEVPPGAGTPNDNHIAVGNDGKIVSVMNTVIRVHNDTGKVIKAFTLENFALNPNIKKDPIPTLNRTYDPRVVYDPYTDRYIVLYMHGTTDKTSFIVVGFSSSNDPTKPWNVYKIPGTPIQDSVWSDYPIVSQTKEDLFFTVNLLHNGSSWEEGFVEAVIWQLNKDDGYRGDTLNKNFFHNIKYEGVSIWSICAIQNGPMPGGVDNYFLSVRPYTKENDTVFVHRITNTLRSGQANYELGVFKSPLKYGFPSSALVPDTAFRLRTNDARVLSGVRMGSQLHYFQNCLNFKTLQAHIMHGSIYNLTLPSGKMASINETGTPGEPPASWNLGGATIQAHLYTNDSLDFGYPAVAAAGAEPKSESDPLDPSMVVTSVFSGSKHFPGTGAFFINRYGEHSDYQILKKGQSIINYTFIKPAEQRWGDYEGIQAKFNEKGVFYLVGSWGKSNSMFAYVARVKLQDTVFDNPIASVRVFPVPTTENVQIEIQNDVHASIKGQIYTADGKLIAPKSPSANQTLALAGDQSFSISIEPGTHRYALHTLGLPKGVYFLRLQLTEGRWSAKSDSQSFKFIVQ